MELKQPPVMKTAMLIRQPAADVFEAFADPMVTTKFWFSGGSGRLEAGSRVQWQWQWYGINVDVHVQAIEPGRRIAIAWGSGDDLTPVEWVFNDRGDGTTFVEVTHSGFRGDADAMVAQALDSMGGFSLALAGAKAWLEHGIQLNLVPDRFPDGHV